MSERRKKWLFRLLLCVIAVSFCAKTHHAAAAEYGEAAYSYMDTLQREYPQRVTGTETAVKAREWLISQCNALGYGVQLQDAVWTDKNETQYRRTNLIMEKSGESERLIVIGAHYDSVMTNGADDNASGVGLLLETAKNCSSRENLPYTIRFILFDMEEPGCYGSQYYVSQLSDQEKEQIICMINLDTLCGGDNMYLYGGGYDGETISDTWVAEQALAAALQMELPMSYHPDVNKLFPVPVKHTASDQMAFSHAGIPYLYFEASNWKGGKLNNFYQTSNPSVTGGQMMHIPEYDNLAFYNETFPGRVMEHLKSYSTLLDLLILNIKEESTEFSESDSGSPALLNATEGSEQVQEQSIEQQSSFSEAVPQTEEQIQNPEQKQPPLTMYGINIKYIISAIVIAAFLACLSVFLIQHKNIKKDK